MKRILILGNRGYIGSALCDFIKHNTGYLLGREWSLTGIDLNLFPTDNNYSLPLDYNTLSEDYISRYDVVIMLGGISSAPYCKQNPQESYKANVTDFVNLVNKLPNGCKFIYASSASVYGLSGSIPQTEQDTLKPPVSPYDHQKQFLDVYSALNLRDIQYYGLRFGTVCGYSGTPRNELLLNAMTRASKLDGVVRVSSPDSYRAVLYMQDLIRAILCIITQNKPKGIYNLCSFNTKIGDLGNAVAKLLNVPLVIDETNTSLYSFTMDTTKFINTYNFEFSGNIENIVQDCLKNNFNIVR